METPDGTFRTGLPFVSAPKVEGKFKGEWVNTLDVSYKAQDIVKISTGPNAGTYVALQNIPGGSANQNDLPWYGVNWTLIGRVVDQSNWL